MSSVPLCAEDAGTMMQMQITRERANNDVGSADGSVGTHDVCSNLTVQGQPTSL